MSADVISVDVRTVMPRLRNAFSSSAEMAASSFGTRRGSSSMMVTSLPNWRKIDANSTPTAPLPRMAIEAGISGRLMASSLVMMFFRSTAIFGTVLGADPVATMISFADSTRFFAPVTSTLPAPRRLAVPVIDSTLFFRNRNSTPLVSPATIAFLRACTRAMSRRGGAVPSKRMPQSAAFNASLKVCACSSNAFVGMQPRFRQVPPRTGSRSTTAVRNPSCDARMAATYPPVPEPMTTTSYASATVLSCQPQDGTHDWHPAESELWRGPVAGVQVPAPADGRTRSVRPSTSAPSRATKHQSGRFAPGPESACVEAARTDSNRLLAGENGVFELFRDASLDDGLGWNLDRLTGRRVAALPRLSLLDHELCNPRKNELARALQLLLGEAVQFIEHVANLRPLQLELVRKVREQFHLAHAPGVCHAFFSLARARVSRNCFSGTARATVRQQ